ncbi:MAG: soluble lytic murein transglycosylase, partial [Acidobacteriota bacterium]|nr:soluble lytic murein transglycosylase [Acidobacteriota bacterium]
PSSNPLEKAGPDWGELAEKNMPGELRLAYELTALSDMRDAFNETRGNMSRENARFAEALLADYYHSQGSALLMYTSLRRAWPQLATAEQDTVPAYFLRMYYPLKYGDAIEKYSKKQNIDPNLVRGLILQESYYNTRAKSRVGATGLMQLMPPTAKDHARSLHVPFAASRLENPDVNVQLGTFHLRMLINMFNGNPYLAVASYNAGQGNVMKWRRAAPKKPLDEFLESIPFPETRNYVKRVTMLRATYARITGSARPGSAGVSAAGPTGVSPVRTNAYPDTRTGGTPVGPAAGTAALPKPIADGNKTPKTRRTTRSVWSAVSPPLLYSHPRSRC